MFVVVRRFGSDADLHVMKAHLSQANLKNVPKIKNKGNKIKRTYQRNDTE